MDFLKPKHSGGSLLNKIKNETKIFANINFILDKIESDGYFGTVQDTFSLIFSKEMAFAVSGKYRLHSWGKVEGRRVRAGIVGRV